MQQFITFLFVGGINTVFSYTLYALFIFLHFSYPLAVLLSTCLGVLFNFQTTGKIVFKNFAAKQNSLIDSDTINSNHYHLSTKNNNKIIFIKFIGVYIFLYFLNITMIAAMKNFSDNLYLLGFLPIIPLAMIAFLLNKYLVFRQQL